jgi:hypothetical protein
MQRTRQKPRRAASSHGIVRDDRGQDLPRDKARAQQVTTTRKSPRSSAKGKRQ